MTTQITRTLFAAATFALLAAPALGQSAGDRAVLGISAEPTGVGNRHRIIAPLRLSSSDVGDVSTDIFLSINGSTVGTDTINVAATSGCGPCPLGQLCYCTGAGESNCACDAWYATPEWEVDLQPEDEIMVLLRPSPGAMPEGNTNDDAMMMQYHGDPIRWNRRILSASLEPQTADSFFDVWVDIEVAANYDGFMNVGVTVLLLLDGEPYGEFPTPIDDVLAWTQCTSVPCNDTVACVMDAAGHFYGTCQPGDDVPQCQCRYHPEPMVIPNVLIPPGTGTLEVVLRPVPGALPELPPFPGDPPVIDDIIAIPLPDLCPADVDGSGVVDFADLIKVLSSWGPCAGCDADVDDNDVVDFTDLLAVLAAWGPCPN